MSFHHTLFLRLYVITDGIGLGLHIILLSIAETIDGEVCLKAIATGEFIDTTYVPTESFVSHFVVCSPFNIWVCIRTIRYLVGIVEACIQGEVLIECIGKLLPYDIRTIACE